jgi:hypothetical protein
MRDPLNLKLFLSLLLPSVLTMEENFIDPFGCNETLINPKNCILSSYDYYCTLPRSTQDWFRELYNEALADSPHTRKEIRTLSDEDRQAYIDAVLALKNDKVRYGISFK